MIIQVMIFHCVEIMHDSCKGSFDLFKACGIPEKIVNAALIKVNMLADNLSAIFVIVSKSEKSGVQMTFSISS